MSGLGYPERARYETEVDNELDRLFAEAEEVDRDIDRLLTEAGFDVSSAWNAETSALSNIVEASSESVQSTGDGDVESDTHLRPLASTGTLLPLRPYIAADTIRRSIREIVAHRAMPSTVRSIAISGPTIPDEISIENAKRAFLQSLPLLPASDDPEAINTCPICQEAFENTARPEVPVRLPCHHVFGALCISRWISIRRTCPLCRAVLFEPSSPSTPVGGGAEGSLITTQLVHLPRLPRIAPLLLLLTEGSEEENIRRIEVHILELAEKRRWLIGSRDSLITWDARRMFSRNPGDVLTQIEVCLRSNATLTNTLRTQQDHYRSRI